MDQHCCKSYELSRVAFSSPVFQSAWEKWPLQSVWVVIGTCWVWTDFPALEVAGWWRLCVVSGTFRLNQTEVPLRRELVDKGGVRLMPKNKDIWWRHQADAGNKNIFTSCSSPLIDNDNSFTSVYCWWQGREILL